MNPDPKKKPEQKKPLPSITKGPVHERRSTHRCDILTALRPSKGRLSTVGKACSEIPEKALPKRHGRESVVRGLPRIFSEMSKGPPSEMIGVKCQRCQTEDARFRVFTDAIDIHVCLSCAEVARQLKIDTEDLSRTGKPSNLVQLREELHKGNGSRVAHIILRPSSNRDWLTYGKRNNR